MKRIKKTFFASIKASAVLLLVTVGVSFGLLVTAGVAPMASNMHHRFIYDRLSHTVVRLTRARPGLGIVGGGTGAFIRSNSGKTYILTNRHVCQSEFSFMNVQIGETEATFKARILARSQTSDLCLLSAPDGIVGLPVSNRANLEPGVKIWTMGHPDLQPQTMFTGESGVTKIVKYMANYATNCQFQNQKKTLLNCMVTERGVHLNSPAVPGSSGSPIVDFNGELVGIVWGRTKIGTGLAVPLSNIKAFLKDY